MIKLTIFNKQELGKINPESIQFKHMFNPCNNFQESVQPQKQTVEYQCLGLTNVTKDCQGAEKGSQHCFMFKCAFVDGK